MHHYTTAVSPTFSPRSLRQEVWATVVPEEATTHPWLMHGLLALSALHLSQFDLKNQCQYRRAAVRYQHLSIPSLRAMISNTNKQNCASVFAAATFIAVFTFAFRQTAGTAQAFDPIKELFTVFELMKGLQVLTDNMRRWIIAGKLGPLLQIVVPESPGLLPADLETRLEQLELRNRTLTQSDSTRTIFEEAIRALRLSFRAVAFNPNEPQLGMLWLSIVERPYTQLLKAGDPMALVILAHQGILLYPLRDLWYTRDWGYQLVKAVYDRLEPAWRPWIQWPMNEVHLQPTLYMSGGSSSSAISDSGDPSALTFSVTNS